jgi:prepilin-type N-terminal cleavage/methylation domain-containing protein
MQSQRIGHHFRQASNGFTIVELLIVVVVIAILAAITIVAYNGITQRATASALQSGAETAAKKLSTFSLTNGEVYPPDLATAGLTNTGTIGYQYSYNNSTSPPGYCITATTNNTAYYIASNFVYSGGTVNQPNPASGACPGHSATGAAITNYSLNPGVEVGLNNLNGANGTTFVRDNSKAHTGTYSLLLTMPQTATTLFVGAVMYSTADFTTLLSPSTTYTVSAWVWVPSSTVDIILSVQGTGKASATNPTDRLVTAKNQWVRMENTFTTTATAGTLNLFAVNNTATPVAGTQFWLDDIMITQGTTMLNNADGNTPGWIWNGSSGISTSTGPPV